MDGARAGSEDGQGHVYNTLKLANVYVYLSVHMSPRLVPVSPCREASAAVRSTPAAICSCVHRDALPPGR